MNEELEYYVGMDVNEVSADLKDKGVRFQIVNPNVKVVQLHDENRVNLIADTRLIVTHAFYG